jgi:hypothetical protein
MRALLARVAEGGGSGVMTELNRLAYSRVQIPVGQTMRCTDFAAKTIETREVRQKKEAEAAAAKRQRESELRKQHLAGLYKLSWPKLRFERVKWAWNRCEVCMT